VIYYKIANSLEALNWNPEHCCFCD